MAEKRKIVETPNETIVKKRLISAEELKLYEEAENNIETAIQACKKAVSSLKFLSDKVQDGWTSFAFQEFSNAKETFEESRQLVAQSRTRFNEMKLEDFIHIDLITSNIIKFLPIKDILNLRVTSKRMYRDVTRLSEDCQVLRIDLSKPIPPSVFTSERKTKLVIPSSNLEPYQKDVFEKCAHSDRIIGLDVRSFQAFINIPKSVCEIIDGLQSLTVSDFSRNLWHCDNIVSMINKSADSLQELCLEGCDVKEVFKDVKGKFGKLRKLHIQSDEYELDYDVNSWGTVVSMINNCPNLVDLRVEGITFTEDTIAPHPKIRSLTIQNYYWILFDEDMDGAIKLIMSCNNLEVLKIDMNDNDTINIWKYGRWFHPGLKRVEIGNVHASYVKPYLKRHFDKDVLIIERCGLALTPE